MQADEGRTLAWKNKSNQRSESGAQHHSLEHELGPAVLDACRTIWSEFVELASVDPRSFADDEKDLVRWYAELQFQLGRGGGRCTECRAHVRQAIPMRVEIGDRVRDFLCLCNRCIVGFEHEADYMWYLVAGKHIEHPIRCGRTRKKAA